MLILLDESDPCFINHLYMNYLSCFYLKASILSCIKQSFSLNNFWLLSNESIVGELYRHIYYEQCLLQQSLQMKLHPKMNIPESIALSAKLIHQLTKSTQ